MLLKQRVFQLETGYACMLADSNANNGIVSCLVEHFVNHGMRAGPPFAQEAKNFISQLVYESQPESQTDGKQDGNGESNEEYRWRCQDGTHIEE